MIVDYLENINKYSFVNKNFKKGVEFALTLFEEPVGRYEYDEIFAFVQMGDTKPTDIARFESHKKYLDVQIMVQGEEVMAWQNINMLSETVPYDADSDIMFYSGEGQNLNIKKGMFYIVDKTDAHKVCSHIDKQTTYKKVVLKLEIE